MNFLAPLFFVALAGLAIPVLLHLTQREKKQIVRFPSLMFVRRIPYQSVRRRKIHNWLLLMLRLAALALIVLAFARPLIQRTDAAAPAGAGAREVVVLLDTSYSMGFGDRWESARAAAYEQIDELTSADRGSVILFSSGAEIAVRSAVDRSGLTAAVAAAKPGSGATRYAPALKVAGGILADSLLPRRDVILISDFQRGGWRGEEGARLPQGSVLTPVPVTGSEDQANVSVNAVSLARSTFSDQERVAVTAGLTNRSDVAVTASSVTLEIDGIKHGTQPLQLEPGASTSVTFDPVIVRTRNMRGTVTVADDALVTDNAFHFVVSPSEPVRIAVGDRGSRESGLFLSRALAIGESPRFETVTRQADALSDADLQRSAVVILHDVTVAAPLARRLKSFVERGGGLFVATGPRAGWPADVDLLPGSIGNPQDRRRGEAARVSALEYSHPIFEPFRAPRSGNFSTVPVYGYRRIVATPDAQVLATFDGTDPAVLERRVGSGRVVLWASTLDSAWSELPTRGVFLPFIHQSMRHLSQYTEPRPWLTVGQVLDASSAPLPKADAARRVVLTPSGRRVPLQDEESDVMELTEQGFYELRGPNDTQNAVVVAANVDAAESDLTAMDPKEIVAIATGGPGDGGGGGGGVPMTPEAQEKNQHLWWYLLVAGSLLLGAETVLSNRMAKA
jgi:hypothetical protein